MGKWHDATIGDTFDLTTGYAFKSADFVPAGIPVIKIKNVKAGYFREHEFSYVSPKFLAGRPEKLAQANDLLISMSGNRHDGSPDTWVGKVAIFQKSSPYFINQRVGALRPKKTAAIDVRFFGFLLSSIPYQELFISIATSSGGQANLSPQQIFSAPVRYPDLRTQQEIASLLGALDDKIELNRQTNDTLEALARAIFKDWFVDFGPTRAKAEGRSPYLAPELWDLFPDALEDHDKPEGWRIGTVGECFHLTMGQSPPGSTYNDDGDGLPFFQGRTDFGFRYPESRKYCSAPTRIAQTDDTLISVRAPVGDINMAWAKCCVGRGVAALRHMSGSVSFTYYSAWAIQQELQQYEHTGTVFGAINKKQFEALKTIEPATEIVRFFDEYVGPLDQRIRENVSETRTLAQTRDLLLPKLMSGEIRLREAEKIVEDAA